MSRVVLMLMTVAVLAMGVTDGNVIKDLEKNLEKGVNELTSQAKAVCLSNDGCNQNFFNLNNYCCQMGILPGQCCNYVKFVFRDSDRVWDNFITTCRQPRVVNILLFIVFVLVLCAVTSIIMSIVGYFCCGCSKVCCCCGSKKYTIVSH